MRFIALLALAMLAAACQPTEKFRIVPGNPTLKVNTETGETWRYDAGFSEGPFWKKMKDAP